MVAEDMAGGASSWALACWMAKNAEAAASAMAIANSRSTGFFSAPIIAPPLKVGGGGGGVNRVPRRVVMGLILEPDICFGILIPIERLPLEFI